MWSGARWEEGDAVDEKASAVGASARSWGFEQGLFLGREVEPEGEMDEGGDPGERDRGGWVEEAVIADFDEAFGQDVLEESADELHHI